MSAPEIEDVLALSPLQEGLFSLARLAGDDDLYTMQFVIEVGGPVDAALLRRCVEVILDRHANLRAAFWDRDLPKPVQIVPTRVDLPWFERNASAAEFDALAESEARTGFDLASGPALRVVLVTLPDGSRRMVVTAHHILMDGWSLGVFFRELFALYEANGSATALPDPRPYRDYIGWLASRDSDAAAAKWADYLGAVSGPLIVADRTDSTINTVVPQLFKQVLEASDTDRLQSWARTNGLTMNTVVQFAWSVVQSRLTDRRDLVFGTTVSGRPQELAGVETMIGLFINTIPVRVLLEDNDSSVVGQCVRLQRESAVMRDNGYLSLSTIQRAAGKGALFDTLFVYENAPVSDVLRPITTGSGTRFRPIHSESLTHYPLAVVCFLLDGELTVVVEAVEEMLPQLSLPDIGTRLISVLRQLPDIGDGGLSGLDVLLPSERPEQPVLPAADVAGVSVADLFARQVAATPDAVALTSEHERYTYRELHHAATSVASELLARGVEPEDVVALSMPRSPQSIVAILGVLCTGAAYVPIDITLPDARIESILRQAKPKVVLTADDVASALERGAELAGPVAIRPDQCAYLIFTSGSTGEPKGVMGTHAAIAAYFADHRDRVYRPAFARLNRPLRIAHAWSLSFDASWQPMIGLLDGHSIHLFDADDMRDADGLVAGIARHHIDMIDTTPSMFTQLAAAGLTGERAPLAVLALGGEAISAPLWKRLCALPDTAVHNCYGPTETTVEAVVASVTDMSVDPTIGSPVTGMTSYIFGSGLRVVPDGVVGELYLSGAQVARGYVGKPAVTADRFVADPFRAGERMYRTGDLVRRLPSGDIGYLGRADDQVKIRGYRIEIGDIETALLRLSGVDAAAVVVLARPSGPTLVGFAAGADLEPVRLRAALTDRLPGYMIPSRVLTVPQLPVTTNGKLDVRALTELAQDAYRVAAGSDSAPQTATERILCSVFAELTGGTAPGIDDDLVDLGLDSIAAIALVNSLRRADLAISPRMILAAQTIRDLAEAIDNRPADDYSGESFGYGDVGTVPIVSWMHEFGGYRRLALNMLVNLPSAIDRTGLETVLQVLLDGHDMLRSRFAETAEGYTLTSREPGSVRAADVLSRVESDGEFGRTLQRHARATVDEIDPRSGAMVRAVWFAREDADDVLLLSIHHLAVDPVSWQVVFNDLARSWEQLESGTVPKPVVEFTGYRQWADLTRQRSGTPEVTAQLDYWLSQSAAPDPTLGSRRSDPRKDTWASYGFVPASTTVEATATILSGLTKDIGVREFLLAAVTVTLAAWRSETGADPAAGAYVAMEGHGREDAVLGDAVDTSQTVGWFTSVFPARFGHGADAVNVLAAQADPSAARAVLTTVAERVGAVPNNGVDYGLLRYIDQVPELVAAPEPQIMFDYLGRLDLGMAGSVGAPWAPIGDLELQQYLPVVPEPDFPLRYPLDVIAGVQSTPDGPQLITLLRWSAAVFTAEQVERIAELWHDAVAALTAAL
ncbi:amino acid adenylation domain-containing protein [Antrihabitans sp. NCIMB 15449]|uniref:Amino acid adenylation domain-containing protein n=1 Tax=Antrihabitans spumae TaxID=3373370 RepID=A0ABW7JI44_9NOCA